ncbi:cytochrome P450 [Amycolatopsis aidingensis]|uniref:cytochrome P450 n=1 Tax=Amycolatopsis aidingensis TaxID=2842453 RepID=UPI001C0D86DD|nr:cytochrome P450 [Amycolatopsis aidingensis]
MTETAPPTANGLPTTRPRPLDPPEEISRLRTEQPISRMTYPDGHHGWLVTDYAHARAILADPRFSAKAELKHPPVVSRRLPAQAKPSDLPPGMFVHQDPPEHTRYRRLLTGQFTVRRMNRLARWIEGVAREHAAAMRRAGPPADLVREFALPIPSLVICELLGVRYADRGRFQQDAATMLNLDTEYEDAMAAFGRVLGFLGELVRHKRSEPGDDLLSGLVAGGELDDAELAGVGLVLLIAGHETTANMLALGTYTLLREPEQLAALRADPGLLDTAVEELLRYLTIVHLGTQRTPLEDVELDGVLLRRGETVLLHLPAANRDPDRFAEPDRLDLTRHSAGHLAFGHGVHQCLGQQLARIEMRAGFAALLEEFPELRLAVPAEEVPMREQMAIYGVHRLPVHW